MSGKSVVFCLKTALLTAVIVQSLFCSSSLGYQDNVPHAVAIDQRLGQAIPPDLTFYDESGVKTTLRDFLGKPAVVTLVYYSCSHVCPQVLGGIAEVLPRLTLAPGRDYAVLAISFDDEDSPEVARAMKTNYLKAIGTPFPEDAWRFLTGDKENIKKLTDAAGLTYQKENHGFTHPSTLIILSPGGKIAKYIYASKYQYGVAYPVTFSPVDLATALTDASHERVSRGITQPVCYCFPHEPGAHERFFRLLGIVGMGTLLGMTALFVYLRVTARKAPEERT